MKLRKTLLLLLAFLCLSSVLLETASQPYFTVLSAGMAALFWLLETNPLSLRRIGQVKIIRFAFLILFYGLARLDWCLLLFVLASTEDAFFFRTSLRRHFGVRIIFLTYALAFVATLFTYRAFTPENLVYALFVGMSFFVTRHIFSNLLYREAENRKLHHQNRYLSTHDPLTGLVNFQEFHRQLEKLIARKKPLILVLIDCHDLKSMNVEQGFQEGNRILKQTAELLTIVFSSHHVISRYGGDEFALALKLDHQKNTVDRLDYLLKVELPKLTGIHLTYGHARFPRDGEDKDTLLLKAEANLFSMKRERWLKREEHMLRTEKLRLVGELASGMAHEIRNPLTTIKGFLQVSRQHRYNIAPWYDIIMSEIRRMSELTAEFLQFSKPHETHFRAEDLHDCLDRVVFLAESEASRLGHRILYTPLASPVRVMMDPDKMVQMLLNLVKNAFEAMPNQGVVTIRMKKGSSQVSVSISDTGVGIPESELDKIFHPFYTTKEKGTGLGLSICHKIVHDHGGTLEVESVPQKGTTFTITFQLAEQLQGQPH